MTTSETNKEIFDASVSGISYEGMRLLIHPADDFWGVHLPNQEPFVNPHPKPTPVLNPILHTFDPNLPSTSTISPPSTLVPEPFIKPPLRYGLLPTISGFPDQVPNTIAHPPIVNLLTSSHPTNPSGPIFNPILGNKAVAFHDIPSTSIQIGTLTSGDLRESALRKTYTALIDGTLDFKSYTKFVANGIIPVKLTFVPAALPPQCNVIKVLYALNAHPEKLDHKIKDTLPEIKAHIVVNAELGNQKKNENGTVFVYTDQTKNSLAGQMHQALKFSTNVWLFMYRENRYVKVILAPRPIDIQHIPTPENPRPTPTNTNCTLL